jgi:hypothetical protein
MVSPSASSMFYNDGLAHIELYLEVSPSLCHDGLALSQFYVLRCWSRPHWVIPEVSPSLCHDGLALSQFYVLRCWSRPHWVIPWGLALALPWWSRPQPVLCSTMLVSPTLSYTMWSRPQMLGLAHIEFYLRSRPRYTMWSRPQPDLRSTMLVSSTCSKFYNDGLALNPVVPRWSRHHPVIPPFIVLRYVLPSLRPLLIHLILTQIWQYNIFISNDIDSKSMYC